jgi:hypothetical protein
MGVELVDVGDVSRIFPFFCFDRLGISCLGYMVNELRSYRYPKAKKSFLAISQGCAPLSPDAAKSRGQRNYGTSTIIDLEIPQVSTLKRLRSVLYHKETTQEVISEKYSEWVSNNQYLIFEQKRHHSPMLGKFANVGENSRFLLNINKN